MIRKLHMTRDQRLSLIVPKSPGRATSVKICITRPEMSNVTDEDITRLVSVFRLGAKSAVSLSPTTSFHPNKVLGNAAIGPGPRLPDPSGEPGV
jgi:hypothetical protein